MCKRKQLLAKILDAFLVATKACNSCCNRELSHRLIVNDSLIARDQPFDKSLRRYVGHNGLEFTKQLTDNCFKNLRVTFIFYPADRKSKGLNCVFPNCVEQVVFF